jgi:hypothetical protein
MSKKRTCLRCGCTDAKACEGGCAWVGETNVCDKCLTKTEVGLFSALAFNKVSSDQLVANAIERNHEVHALAKQFESLLQERSELVNCIQMLRAVVLEVTPQIGKIVLQDYGRLNRGLMLARKLVGEVKP